MINHLYLKNKYKVGQENILGLTCTPSSRLHSQSDSGREQRQDKYQGFTLVETLLYISIVSIMLITSSFFVTMLLQSRIKNQAILEVDQQGIYVLQVVTQAIRNADIILTPTPNNTINFSSFNTVDGQNNPKNIVLSGGIILITEGAGAPISLTNSRVIASNLVFQNLSRPNTPGILRISFTLSHVNPEGRQEYAVSKSFYTSASLHQP